MRFVVVVEARAEICVHIHIALGDGGENRCEW